MGFGAVILQKEKFIYFTARIPTSAEQNYQNLKRDAMPAVWGMKKFHYFLHGEKFSS